MVTNPTSDGASVAASFNDATKLQYINLSNKPPLYKVYPGLRAIPLPDVAATSGLDMSTLRAIRGAGETADAESPPTLHTLAQLLYHAAAVIRRRTLRDGEVHYRAAASAGALYPTEVYVVCGDLDGLRAGVYHFNPLDFTLARPAQRRPAAVGSRRRPGSRRLPGDAGVHHRVLEERLEIP